MGAVLKENQRLKRKFINLKNKELPKEAIYWNDRHPKRLIAYKGRIAPGSSKIIEVPVQLFIQPNDPYIIEDIEKNDLYAVNDRCNDQILKIYKHTRIKPSNPYRYKYDEVNTGYPEYWMFPFELRNAKAGDCDDWGNELASYLIAAGVPNWRVRCVVGNTWIGGGHLTVYVLADNLVTWTHLNSTTPYSRIKGIRNLNDLPTTNDPTDKIGIEKVWFSYNNQYAWHKFETKIEDSKIVIQNGDQKK